MHRTTARLSAALLSIALVTVAAPAVAHVSVSSTDAAPGGFGKTVFRVPTESDTASTTQLEVTLPADTPFAFVTAGTKPGWEIETVTEELPEPTTVGDFELTEAVRTITWTATGDGIPPEQFDEFAISGGPFPDAESMSFAAVQTYSDGEVVAWDQVAEGEEEPELPAPVLALDASSSSTAHGSTADEADDATEASSDTDGRDALPIWLAGGALLVAAGALVVAVRENRRRA